MAQTTRDARAEAARLAFQRKPTARNLERAIIRALRADLADRRTGRDR